MAQVVQAGGIYEAICGYGRQKLEFSSCSRVCNNPWSDFEKVGRYYMCRQCADHSEALNLVKTPGRSGGSASVCRVRAASARWERAVRATMLALMPHFATSTNITDTFDAYYYYVNDYYDGASPTDFFGVQLMITIMILFSTFAAVWWRRFSCKDYVDEDFELVDYAESVLNDSAPGMTNKRQRTVAVQAMVTYKRKWSKPQFRMLPDNQQGCFGELVT